MNSIDFIFFLNVIKLKISNWHLKKYRNWFHNHTRYKWYIYFVAFSYVLCIVYILFDFCYCCHGKLTIIIKARAIRYCLLQTWRKFPYNKLWYWKIYLSTLGCPIQKTIRIINIMLYYIPIHVIFLLKSYCLCTHLN